MAYEFYLGLDPDNDSEKLTIALVEKATYAGEEVPTYHVRRLEQREGMAVEEVCGFVKNLIAETPYVGRTEIIVNRTDKRGRKLLDCLAEEGLSPVGAAISGGDSARRTSPNLAQGRGGDSPDGDGGYLISEHELVETIEELYHDGQLKMEQDSEAMSALAAGLQSYEARAPEAGYALNHIQADAPREADHDSFVLGTALACWYGEQHATNPAEHLRMEDEDDLPTTGEAKRMLRPDTVN